MRTLVQRFWRKGCAAALVLAALGLALTCGITSPRWIGTPFPGFFIMANRVVASVSLPHWPVANHSHIYQHAMVAVNGQALKTSEELYATVRQLPPGSAVTYTLEKHGQTSQVTLPSQTFTLKDYCLLFGAYFFNGLTLILIGLGVWLLKPVTPASRALLSLSLALGVFFITAVDLYSPYWFFRVHVLSEAFFPASLVHLALVFPADHLRRYRSLSLSVPYLIAFTLTVAYEAFLYHPAAYSFIHNLCMVYAGIGGLALLAGMIANYWTTVSMLIRQRIRVILLGCFSGYAFPAVLMLVSGVGGGEVAVNYAAFTAFLFPLSLGYASVKQDPFEIDTMVKRGIGSLALIALVVLTLS